MSHQQDVLLPQVPLFLVDRGWRIAKSKARPTKGTILLYGQDTCSDSTNNAQKSDTSLAKIGSSVFSTTGRKEAIERKSYGPVDGADTLVVQQSQEPFKPDTSGPLQFINAVGPPHLNRPDLRKLVKSHVKKRSNQEKRVRRPTQSSDGQVTTTQAQSKLENAQIDASGSVALSSIPSSVCAGSTTMYYGQGNISSTMTPRAHSLLDYYLQEIALSWYPFGARLGYNPVRSEWFPLALKHEMLFQSVLFSSASRLADEDGRAEFEPDILIQPVLHHLNKTIQEAEAFSDTTIAIVSCLAMVGISLGSYDQWQTHMSAIKEMVRIRGGVRSLDRSLQKKIIRADLAGAADSVVAPYLEAFPRSTALTSPILMPFEPVTLGNTLQSILIQCCVCEELRCQFTRLLHLSHAVDHVLNGNDSPLNACALDEDFMQLQHDLLLWPNTGEDLLNEACRLGALIYTKSMTRSLSTLSKRSTRLVQKLADSIADFCQKPEVIPLTVWLCLIGSIAVPVSSSHRKWFIDCLAEIRISNSKFCTWEDIKALFSNMLWVPHIHETPFKQVWSEVETISIIPKVRIVKNK